MSGTIMDALGLAEKLRSHGLVAYVVSGSEIKGDEKPDVVAMRDGKVAFFKIVELSGRGSDKRVVDKSKMLLSNVSKADDGRGNVNGYFAISKGRDPKWYLKEYTAKRLSYREEYQTLEEKYEFF